MPRRRHHDRIRVPRPISRSTTQIGSSLEEAAHSWAASSLKQRREPVWPDADRERIPPGQTLVDDFPVCMPDRWHTSVRSPSPLPSPAWSSHRTVIDWDQLLAYPAVEQTCDLHCVTTWSKLDTHWKGVRVSTILAPLSVDPGGAARRHPRRRRMDHQPASRRAAARRRTGGLRIRGPAPLRRTRRPRPSAGAPPLPVEERQVAGGHRAHGRAAPGLLGDSGLPRAR